MPSHSGHQSGLAWKCTVCGEPISYKDACRELLDLGTPVRTYPRVAALFVGLQGRSSGHYSTLTLSAGEESMTKDAFVAAKTTGSGSWFDFRTRYRSDLEGWLDAVGFAGATYRILVVDSTDPLSVLAISTVQPRGTIIFAVIADQDSTPMQQNTSYVALKLASKRGFPVVLASKAYAQEVAYFAEGEGFQVGEKALGRAVDLISAAVDDIAQFLVDDLRLGVNLHCFSSVLSASDAVYKTLDDALSVQLNATSLIIYPDEVQTLFLAAFSGSASQQDLERSFTQYRSKNLKGVITAGRRIYPRPGDPRLYDLVTIFGMRESEVIPLLTDGYLKVAERSRDLRVEALD
ncbi:MAG: hypothetical protein JRN24_02490 [Nitrososphaerota archaeon]|nr:hypothetical protein [Nitrososphaerota archaeon]